MKLASLSKVRAAHKRGEPYAVWSPVPGGRLILGTFEGEAIAELYAGAELSVDALQTRFTDPDFERAFAVAEFWLDAGVRAD